MTRNQKLGAAGAVIAALIAAEQAGWINTAAPSPAPTKHDCSGEMKAAMANNPQLAAMRERLCDQGGEAQIDAYIAQKREERAAPAY